MPKIKKQKKIANAVDSNPLLTNGEVSIRKDHLACIRLCFVKLRRTNLETVSKASRATKPNAIPSSELKEAKIYNLKNCRIRMAKIGEKRITTPPSIENQKAKTQCGESTNHCFLVPAVPEQKTKEIRIRLPKIGPASKLGLQEHAEKAASKNKSGDINKADRKNDNTSSKESKPITNFFKRTNKQTAVPKSNSSKGSYDKCKTAVPSVQTTQATSEILLSTNVISSVHQAQQIASKKSPKFFHRDNNKCQENNLNMTKTNTAPVATNKAIAYNKMPTNENKANAKPNKRFANRTTFRRRSSINNNIYEFISQSMTSDSDNNNDPAFDIIRKLIDEGKVRVATRRKGKGKPVIKRAIKNVKSRAIVKRAAAIKRKKVEKQNSNEIKTQPEQVAASTNTQKEDVQNYYEDDFPAMPDSPPPAFLTEEENAAQLSMVAEKDRSNFDYLKEGPTTSRKALDSSANGFSSLARSVLMKQAGKRNENNLKLNDKNKLLEIAKKFVSTPVRKTPTTPALNVSNMSPIHATSPKSTQRASCPSPWRVDDAHLPSVFHFSRNSSNLPSFSSDFIPQTPRKNKTSLSLVNASKSTNELATNDIQSPQTTPPSAILQSKSHNSFNSISSFSSNDSNAENMPPAATSNTVAENQTDSNADVFNLRTAPNPRRALSYRSPLKAINILEVVSIPAARKEFETSSDNSNKSANETESPNKSKTVSNNKSVSQNLFGFEEFLDDNVDDTTKISTLSAKKTSLSNKELAKTKKSYIKHAPRSVLSKKLQELKKWRPNETEIPLIVHKTPCVEALDEGLAPSKQLNIKEMLCSTMIHTDPKEFPVRIVSCKVNNFPDDTNSSDINMNSDDDSVLLDAEAALFKDPQSSFANKTLQRTYIKPTANKRKRRQKQNLIYTICSDDESASEDEASKSKSPQKKRQRKHKNDKQTAQLEQFIEEFNTMVHEVDQFELPVEPCH